MSEDLRGGAPHDSKKGAWRQLGASLVFLAIYIAAVLLLDLSDSARVPFAIGVVYGIWTPLTAGLVADSIKKVRVRA
jgi:hypothetical protein